ncbi:EAL domain-containing protein [Paraburkholderia dilworthii]|uniref:EAL domain-containing protein n=1 Tax=Paraburkholderia dilworthii TaxID=948106 RepID=UPI00040C2471|nr:EAL domain-containing protein [Paraburkholderia dilworthii]
MDSANDALERMSKLVTVNTKTVSALGARAMVLGKFLDAALQHLTTLQRAAVAKSFGQGIEEAMSLMDDVPLPAEYHSALLELTNVILATLDHESSRQATLDTDERCYRMLYEATPAMLHSIDSQGRLVSVSDIWLTTLGYTRDEVIGRMWADFLTPASRIYATDTVLPHLFQTGRCEDIEYQAVKKDGTVIDILLSSYFERDMDGAPPLSLTVIEDVTERKRMQYELAEQCERLRVTLHSIGDGVITTDAQGRVEYLNPIAEKLTGWANEAARGMPATTVFRVIDATTGMRDMNPVERCLATDSAVDVTIHAVLTSRDDDEYFIEDSAAPIRNAAGETLGVVLVFRDVSEQRRLNREMMYRATHDTLTGLVNRDEFERRLQVALTSAHKEEAEYALMYIDLDHFKLVNDAGGHAAGDRLLKQVAGVIGRFVRKSDTFARLGGDEFGLIIARGSTAAAQDVAQEICEEIDAIRFQQGIHRLHIGASIGLVSVDQRWPTTATLLRAADSACFAAKQGGRNRVHTYFAADEMIESHRSDMQWVRRLERALDQSQFVLHWQQITPLGHYTGGIHGEVLLRLVGDHGQLISPGAFLPAAERFHIASRVDRWVVREVFEWMARHKAALSHVDSMAINLSGQSIGDRDFHLYVLNLIGAMAFDHHKLCFEITETAAIANLSDAKLFFESMRAYGIRFALDDFGSGVSSFAYLKSLPVDYLKIDGQFIRNLEDDRVDQATVRCVREVASITGKKTVAEFVETAAVERLLCEIGIDYAQGFLRHRPAPIDTILGRAEPRL